MFHKLFKRFFLLFSISVSVLSAQAQVTTIDTKSNRENSPYTRFGIGEFRSGINPLMKGMGGQSSAYSDPFAVNAVNPASYASLLLTTYEGSLIGRSRTIASGNNKYKTGMATVNHMNVGLPLGKHGGMAFGFAPITNIYYKLNDTTVVPNYGNAVRTYYGDGSLNYAFIGFAGKVKGLSVGFNFGYLFGSTVYANLLESIDDTANVNDAQFSRVLKVGGVYWKAGAQYEAALNSKLFIRTGATLAMNQNLKTKSDEFWVSYNYSGADTSYSGLGQYGNLKMPLTYSFGVQLLDSNKWLVGIDFSGMSWSKYHGFGRVDSVANMSYKIGVGGQYSPDANNLRSYLNRIAYRLGFYYGQDYIYLRNTPLNYYAVTFGFGLPFKRSTDMINTAFEIGRRGTEANGLFKESFVRCTVGITLNDKWFIKRRYD